MKAHVLFRISSVMIIITLLTLSVAIRTARTALAAHSADYYAERYRPQFHFTPEVNWLNDPNGLVYYQGEYHLFYQYHPRSMVWGPMHWGHAVSTDLVRWTHLPVALFPDQLGTIFSGSIVVDWNNTSGFFTNSGGHGLVAIFTHAGSTQQQSIAYSLDRGRTWIKYAGNPVIPNPGDADFRDPKVFWHAPTSRWVMIVAGGLVRLYSSTNLKTWTLESTLPGVYTECPDLFELPVDGSTTNKKWVLVKGGINAGTEYLIGRFDGKSFVTESGPHILDHGPDFYAPQSWSDIPAADGRRIMLGWMNNINYAQSIPTYGARGAMTVPRNLALKTFPEGVRLVQNPVGELQNLRGQRTTFAAQTISPGTNLLSAVRGTEVEIVAEFQLGTATEFGFRVRTGSTNQTTIGYNRSTSRLFVDRRTSGETGFHSAFPRVSESPLPPNQGRIKFHIIVDRSTVEVFGNDGRSVISSLIFPDPARDGLALYSVGGDVSLLSLDVYKLGRIWPTAAHEPSGLVNGDLEAGNLATWTTISGTAFNNADVTNLTTAVGGNQQPFSQHGSYHLWGYKDGGDGQVGELRSQPVTLGGRGQVNFLVSGGFDPDRLFVALVRASDGATLFKATGHDSETYRRVVWDASAYLGQVVYLRVVDTATGGWGHINFDDMRISTTSKTIVARHSGKCVDVPNASSADGTLLQQWSCVGSVNQQWILSDAGAGYYYLKSPASGKCIDVYYGQTTDGAKIQQWTCVGSANQQWKLVAVGNGDYYLQARHSAKCLDVPYAQTTDGTQLQQWACVNSVNQQFSLR